MDLSGKLIIKVQLNDDIRRIPIHNEDITYDELMLMMQRVFRGKLTSMDDVQIKYKDEDGDLVTIFDSTDLSFAIQCSRILRLTLIVNGQSSTVQPFDLQNIRHELQSIRNIINTILDKSDTTHSGGDTRLLVTNNDTDEVPSQSSMPTKHSAQAAAVKPVQASSKEFDPLSAKSAADDTHSKVASSFGLPSDVAASGRIPDRPDTPDSQSSFGSASQRAADAQHAARHPTTYSPQFPSQPQVNAVQPSNPYQNAYPTGSQQGFNTQSHSGKPGTYDTSSFPYASQQSSHAQQFTPTIPGQSPVATPLHTVVQPGAQGQQQVPGQQPPHPQQMGQQVGPQHPSSSASVPNQNFNATLTPQGQAQIPPQPGVAGSVPGMFGAGASTTVGPHPGMQSGSMPYANQSGYAMYQQSGTQSQTNPAQPPMQTLTNPGSNPYSRGPGATYGASYPRPVQASYQQGYQ